MRGSCKAPQHSTQNKDDLNTKIKNEKRDTTADTNEIHKIVREFLKNLYSNKLKKRLG